MMTIRAIYNTLLLPDVSYYFKKDFFPEPGTGTHRSGYLVYAFEE